MAFVFFWYGRKQTGICICLVNFMFLWVMGTPLVAYTLIKMLENQYPSLTANELPQADAALVLGGGVSGAHPPERPNIHLNSGADRAWFAADLYRIGKVSWILVSGGSYSESKRLQNSAEATREMLITLGVPSSVIRIEGDSRNTLENAKRSLALIRTINAKRILLVTSAAHMPRAMAIFRALLKDTEVTVLPASTDVEGLTDRLHPIGCFFPDAASLYISSQAVKEYLGRFFFLYIKPSLVKES